MPDVFDKNGQDQLWATIRCLVPGCGTEHLVWPEQAERLARRLEAGIGMRYVVGKLRCRKCGWKNASLTFHIAHRIRPWDAPRRLRFPHQRVPEKSEADLKAPPATTEDIG